MHRPRPGPRPADGDSVAQRPVDVEPPGEAATRDEPTRGGAPEDDAAENDAAEHAPSRDGAPGGRAAGRALFRQAVLDQWRPVALGATLAAVHQAGEAMVPVVIGVVIDRAVRGGSVGALAGWIAALAGVFAMLSLGYRFGYRAAERGAERAAHRLRLAVTARVLHPRAGAEAGRLPGEIAGIAVGDAKRVGAVNTAVAAGIAAVAGLVAGGVALLLVSVPLGSFVLLGIPPLLAVARLLGRPLERRSEAEQHRAARAGGVAADLIAGLRVLKGIHAESAAIARYRRTSRDSLQATVRAARARAWHDGAMLGLTGLFLALVAFVGGRLGALGDITVGQLVAAVGLAQFLLTPLLTLAWVHGEIAQGKASATRIATVLSSPPAVHGGEASLPAGPVRGAVSVEDVTYGPLRGVTFTAAPGELLAIVAADQRAAGALVRLLGRRCDPEGGTVRVDGIDLRTLDPQEVRRAVLVAHHDAVLFAGTVRDDIVAPSDPPAAGHAAPPGKDRTVPVEAAIAAATADQVAAALPAGLDTEIASGDVLSGGQRQRVALARALAADPPVLVLHDPTTAVDAATEAAIAAGIRTVREGATTLMLTTSPTLLAAADRVVLLDGGRAVAEGRHGELVRDDRYREVVLR